jgi:phosphoribosylformimino-5-aminoimidazole carboxamide ribotide isomerase
MQVIPVLDLMAGEVVRAARGERALYRPIRSALAPDSAPVAVVEALLGLHPFDTFYVADLDRIQRRGDNAAVLRQLRRRFPGLSFWVDAGFAAAGEVRGWLAEGLGRPVLGSETLAEAEVLSAFAPDAVVLSLDFRGEAYVGPESVRTRPELWPDRVIAMTLARVGSGEGPDWQRLAGILRQAGGRQVYAAGGLRDAEDLDRLGREGAAGVLAATALHDGRLTAADLARAQQPPKQRGLPARGGEAGS